MHAGCGLIWASQALSASISVIFPFFIQAWAAASGAEWLLDEECPLLPDLEEAYHKNQTHIATSWEVARLFLVMCFTWEVLKQLQPESLADASAFRAALRGSNMPAEKASVFRSFWGVLTAPNIFVRSLVKT